MGYGSKAARAARTERERRAHERWRRENPTHAQIEPFVKGARVIVRAPHPQRNHPRAAEVLDPPRRPDHIDRNGALVRYDDGAWPGEERVPSSALSLEDA
jgi:hypothetical protein